MERNGRKINWVLLGIATLGNFLAGLLSRIFMISLPTVAYGLQSDILGVSWALISFQLAAIGLSVVFGRLGDIYGRRTLCGLGFIVLTVGSLLCGISRNVIQLIAARFLQGVGAAMVQSVGRALAMDAIPEGWEGKGQAFMTTAYHTGFFAGPALGGLLIDYLHWRAIFFVVLPFSLIGAGLVFLRSSKSFERAAPPRQGTVDTAGVLLFFALAVLLVLIFDRRAETLIIPNQKVILLLVFAALGWIFLVHERKAPSPMVHLPLFKIRMFTFSVISLITLSITRGLVGFIMPFYLQDILSLSPSFMGVLFLTPPVFTLSLAAVSGHMADKIGPRLPTTIGVLATMGTFVLGIFLKSDSHWILPTIMLGLTGIGTGFFNSPNHAALIGSVPREHRGFATGMVHTSFGLGQMLGVSIGGFLLATAFHYYSGLPDAGLTADRPEAFVLAMNATYGAALGLGFVALSTSLLRGSGRIRSASSPTG